MQADQAHVPLFAVYTMSFKPISIDGSDRSAALFGDREITTALHVASIGYIAHKKKGKPIKTCSTPDMYRLWETVHRTCIFRLWRVWLKTVY